MTAPRSLSQDADVVSRRCYSNELTTSDGEAGLSPQVTAERHGPQIAIVVPTFNERGNVKALVDELLDVLSGIEWEVIFVDDDSPDGTADVVREIGRKNTRVRCVQRVGRRGLSSACVEGMLASNAMYLIVMDGDLQHDPVIIPRMIETLAASEIELVVGSRYVPGGSCGDLSKQRYWISRFATLMGHSVLPEHLRDPMSGFFALRRELLVEVVHGLSCLGFKILLDIIATTRRPLALREIPFVFRSRQAGTSKIDALVAWEYLMLLADKAIGSYIPVRFLSFAAIGTLGIGVHSLVLIFSYRLIDLSFTASQILAVGISMVFNYSVNNALTYKDRRLHGFKWIRGLLSFSIVCSIGAVANVGVAVWLFNQRTAWMLATLAGVVVGSVWNYAATTYYTWGRRN